MSRSISLLIMVSLVGGVCTSCSGLFSTPIPTVTLIPTPTLIPTATNTYTPTTTPTQTNTPTTTPTQTSTPTQTPTNTPIPTDTPITTPTSTSKPVTATTAPTNTPTTLAVTVVSQDNLLTNPGFEGGSSKETADLTVPTGWHAWSNCSNVIHTELETHPPHVREGTFAARVWQAYNTCQMGFYQQVNVTSGTIYLLTAYGFSWSTNNPVVGTSSEADITMRVGIDPNGGTNPLASSVVWSDEKDAMDTYAAFTVAATANTGVITVILHSEPDWGMARNDTFWDDASLLMAEK